MNDAKMKRLTLIRHAKSSHAHAWLRDFERPLNERGRRDAVLVGRHLAGDEGFRPTRVVVSAALRTRETAAALAGEGAWVRELEVEEEMIYEAPLEALLAVIRGQPEEVRHLGVVGHNPGMEMLLEWCCEGETRAVVTGAVFHIDLPDGPWAGLRALEGVLAGYVTPALLGGGPD
jgi:phosphohistidine phosphatase